MARTIHTRLRSDQVRAIAALLPALLAGKVPDQHGIARGFRLRLGVEFLSKVKQAFLVKSHGGTDEAGITWPPLTREYLAYGRKFASGEQAKLKKAAGLGRANQKRGLLTAAQNKQWKAIYAQSLKWLAAKMPIGEAKGRAAAIAWAKLKAAGAKTKLDVYGSRQVEILHAKGILFNSLSPGTVTDVGPDASYTPPSDQVMRLGSTDLVVGTSVAYAAYHHDAKGKRARYRRPLWPEPDRVPETWMEDFSGAAGRGLAAAIGLLAGGAP